MFKNSKLLIFCDIDIKYFCLNSGIINFILLIIDFISSKLL